MYMYICICMLNTYTYAYYIHISMWLCQFVEIAVFTYIFFAQTKLKLVEKDTVANAVPLQFKHIYPLVI